ncbi:MAG: Single-stranded-DNA-specific exonuclease RecJ, partial [Parcubacteria group bacterium GW2011_GWA2_47_7]
KYIEKEIRPTVKKIKKIGFSKLIGTAGTMINLASMVYEDKESKPFRLVSHYRLEARDLKKVHKKLLKKNLRELLKMPGLDLKRADIIVLSKEGWHRGVVGIVANKIAEEYDRPTFVWGKEGTNDIKGSCRSDGRINLVDLMRAVPEGVFVDMGGHEFSGGFSVTQDNIHTLEDALVLAHAGLPKKEKPALAYVIDTTLTVAAVNEETYRALSLLAPFGVGNLKPHFMFHQVIIVHLEMFGKEKNHLKLTITDDSEKEAQAIGFFMSSKTFPLVDLSIGKAINLVATLEKSFFRGRPELRLRIVDISL